MNRSRTMKMADYGMQVSVVIPTFNRASSLRRALQSVLNQKGTSFEVLVVDDGSTDTSRALVEQLAQQHTEIRYLFQSRRGPAAARNVGIKKSRAPFVALLDSDDEWLPGKLAAQLEFFEKNPSYLICQTDEIWIRNGKRVNPMKKHKKEGGDIFERCVVLSMVSPSCVMMSKSLFDEIGLFDESLPACEDYDLWLRASARLKIGLIERPYVVRYGGHTDQQSRQFSVMDQFRIRSLVKILKSGDLTPDQKQIASRELLRKCQIVIAGALKRGKFELACDYERVVKEALTSDHVGADPYGSAPTVVDLI